MKNVFFIMLIVFSVSGPLSAGKEKVNVKKISGPEAGKNKQIQNDSRTFEIKADYLQILEVRSLVSGKVSEVLVKGGDRVRTGQLLLCLDSTNIEKEIKDTEESLKNWKEILFKREHWKVRSERAEKQAREKVEEIESLLPEKKMEKIRNQIYSLISGKVLDVVQGGMEIREESVVAEIGDDSFLKVELTPKEITWSERLNKLQDGEKISLIFDEINLACSGELIRRGDKIVIQIPNEKYLISPGMLARFKFEMDEGNRIPPESGEKGAVMEQPGKSIKKKVEVEVSAGLSYSDPGEYHYRAAGIDSLMEQYIENYGVEHSVSGSFKKNIFYIPIQALVNYKISGKWYLKAGVEFGYGNDSSEKTFTLDWGLLSDAYRYDLSSKFTYFMPFIGAETRFAQFGFYANAGFNFLNFSHEMEYQYSAGSLWTKENDSISANGSGAGFLAGGKYFFKIGKKMNCMLKLELCYLKIGNMKGRRDTIRLSSLGETFSESVSGTIYSFEINPYDLGWFYYWELYESAPSGSAFRNVGEMVLNLSSVRLMIGFVF